MSDIMQAQLNRSALIKTFLDLSYGDWVERISVKGEVDVPADIETWLVTAIEALNAPILSEEEMMAQTQRGDYLQALAALSDEALKWIFETFDIPMPELMD